MRSPLTWYEIEQAAMEGRVQMLTLSELKALLREPETVGGAGTLPVGPVAPMFLVIER